MRRTAIVTTLVVVAMAAAIGRARPQRGQPGSVALADQARRPR